MIPILNDETIIREADELLSELMIEHYGSCDGYPFTREQLIPMMVRFYRSAVAGELSFVGDAIEVGQDLPGGYVLAHQTAVDERRRIVALLRRLSCRAGSDAALHADDPSPVGVG